MAEYKKNKVINSHLVDLSAHMTRCIYRVLKYG